MEIQLEKENERDEAKAGDIIRFHNGPIGIVAENMDVFLLKYNDNKENWFNLGNRVGPYSLKNGKHDPYVILFEVKDWKITKK